MRNTGLGISNTTPTNKKISFDQSNLPDENEGSNSERNDIKKIEVALQDEDDDDAVEEVQGQIARDEALELMKMEAKQSVKPKKKRKRKSRIPSTKNEQNVAKNDGDVEDDDGEDFDGEDFDEEFFEQLDSIRKQEEIERKKPIDVSRYGVELLILSIPTSIVSVLIPSGPSSFSLMLRVRAPGRGGEGFSEGRALLRSSPRAS